MSSVSTAKEAATTLDEAIKPKSRPANGAADDQQLVARALQQLSLIHI